MGTSFQWISKHFLEYGSVVSDSVAVRTNASDITSNALKANCGYKDCNIVAETFTVNMFGRDEIRSGWVAQSRGARQIPPQGLVH